MINENEGEPLEFKPVNYGFLNLTDTITKQQLTSETSEIPPRLKTAYSYKNKQVPTSRTNSPMENLNGEVKCEKDEVIFLSRLSCLFTRAQ